MPTDPPVEANLPFNLSVRQLQPELMDDIGLDRREHARALQGLSRIHAATLTPGRIWKRIRGRLHPVRGQTLRLMDVGCSDGWISRQIAKRAQRDGLSVHLIGCDFSAQALEMFREQAGADGIKAELFRVDIVEEELPCSADVVFNSLFLHHFQEQQIVAILQKLRRATERLLLIDDLLRTRLGWYYCQFGVSLLTRSRVVHIDGPLSVRAALTMVEIRDLLDQADLPGVELQRHWPERFLVQWEPIRS